MEPDSEQYYLKLAAAFVRGRDIQGDSIAIPTELREKRLDELEAFEHIPAVTGAVAEVVRVTRRFVVVSAPSKPDNNPQHIHLLDETKLRELFAEAGVSRVNCDYVLGHIVAVANVQTESC